MINGHSETLSGISMQVDEVAEKFPPLDDCIAMEKDQLAVPMRIVLSFRVRHTFLYLC